MLIALGAAPTVLAILAVWVERQALDTDEWVETSSELLADAEIQAALEEYLVDQLYASVDVEAEVRPPEGEETRLERLERLASLHERGVLSDDELEQEKARVLGSE